MSRHAISLVDLREQRLVRDPLLHVGHVLDPPEAGHLDLLEHVVRIPAIIILIINNKLSLMTPERLNTFINLFWSGVLWSYFH